MYPPLRANGSSLQNAINKVLSADEVMCALPVYSNCVVKFRTHCKAIQIALRNSPGIHEQLPAGKREERL